MSSLTPQLTATFAATTGNASAPTAVWKSGDREQVLKRVQRESPSLEALQACVGGDTSPCWRVVASPSCPAGHLVEVDRQGAQPVEGSRDTRPGARPGRGRA